MLQSEKMILMWTTRSTQSNASPTRLSLAASPMFFLKKIQQDIWKHEEISLELVHTDRTSPPPPRLSLSSTARLRGAWRHHSRHGVRVSETHKFSRVRRAMSEKS